MMHLFVAALSLSPIGEAQALKGTVIHGAGQVQAVSFEGDAFSPFAPDTPTKDKITGTAVVTDPGLCRELTIKGDVALEKDESLAAITTGAVGDLKNATIALVRGKREDDMFGYAPISVRVYDGKKLVTSHTLDVTAYPCSVFIDNLDGKAGNEIAVGWISVGAGYSAGVSVLAPQSAK